MSKRTGTKRIKLSLTVKQVDSIMTCLFEYAEQEESLGSPTGKANAKHYRATSDSIRKQASRLAQRALNNYEQDYLDNELVKRGKDNG